MLFNLFLVYGYKSTHFFRISQEMLRKKYAKGRKSLHFSKKSKRQVTNCNKKAVFLP